MANNNNSHSFPHRSLRGPKGLLFGVIIGKEHSEYEFRTLWRFVPEFGTLVRLAIQCHNVNGCGYKTRTQKQVCEIFNTKYPDRRISQSTVSRIENKFREFRNVTDIPKSGRKRILEDEQKLDILLDIQDNPHKPTLQVAADNDM
ncbi:hypothetical protein NQ318_008098 [Aromia moschata]|uniref:DUF4817 domain-containing protein n=1 Tax=Aromia moschata TaxID=1265417 RepID=A0AAV8YPB2_9CUCU|nr:hypothetical protein NQ318_008098 [Aromia moschata]